MLSRVNNVFIKTLLIFSVINLYSSSAMAVMAGPFADLIIANGDFMSMPNQDMLKDEIVKLAQQSAVEKMEVDATTYTQVSDWTGNVMCWNNDETTCFFAQQLAAFAPTVALTWNWHVTVGGAGPKDIAFDN